MAIGEQIKIRRKELRLTQTDLAKRIKVSKQVISNWEREYTYPDANDISSLAIGLDCTADFLLSLSKYPSMTKEGSDFAEKHGIFESKNEERDFAMDYESWTEEEKEEMREFVRFKMEQRKKKRNK